MGATIEANLINSPSFNTGISVDTGDALLLVVVFGEGVGVLTLRTPMDAGPAKIRYRGRKPSTMSMTFVMTSSQVQTLETFVTLTTLGVHRFDFVHPRTGNVVAVRIVSSESGSFQLKRLAATLWEVQIAFEVMP